MSQSAKKTLSQVPSRRRWIGPVGADAMGLAEAAIKRAGFTDPTLVFRWSEIAGPELAGIAEPIRCQQGPKGAVLTVKCDPGAAVFLQHQTRALIACVNAFLGPGAIGRIRVVSGQMAEPTQELPPHPATLRSRAPESGGIDLRANEVETSDPAPASLDNALNELKNLRRALSAKR